MLGPTLAIAAILLASNFTTIYAQFSLQQQDVQESSATAVTPVQPPPIVNEVMTTFQSTDDSFNIGVPQGWIINDLDNTGLALSDEAMMGYGTLAQLCPENEQQSAMVLSNNNTSGSNIPNCQTSENDVIHIIRYPDLISGGVLSNNFTANDSVGGRTTAEDSVLSYHLQKLQELGYRDLQIVNITDTKVNLINLQTNQILATVPAKLVEMAYTVASTPNQIRDGFFVLTSTDATAPYPGTTKGYAVFYEGNSTNNNSTTAGSQIAPASTISSSLPPLAVRQAFGSFELILAPEVAQALLAQQAAQGQSSQATSTADTSPAETNTADTETGGATSAGTTDDGGGGGDSSCHPSYPDVCIPPPPPNLNCDDPGIPDDFVVVGSDPHGFDGDNDGIGCDTPGGAGGSGVGSGDVDDEEDDDEEEDDGGGGGGSNDDEGSSRCPNGYHRSPSGDCERVTDTSGMPRCPNGYHRSPDGDCERVR